MSQTRAILAEAPDSTPTPENALSRHAAAGETTASAATLLACSGLIASCYFMGADWLSQPALGVPTGLWAIALAFALTRGSLRRPSGAWGQTLSRRIALGIPSLLAIASDALQRRAACPDAGSDVVDDRAARLWPNQTHLGRLLARIAHHAPSRARLRIGVPDLDPVLASLRVASIPDVEFVPFKTGSGRPAALETLDAVLSTSPSGEIVIESSEFPGLDAAWYDWSLTPPVSHAAALPLRIDAARCVLGRLLPDDLRPDGLWSHVARSFTALTRTEARLSVADRFRGRAANADLGRAALDDLCAALLDDPTPRTPEVQRIACRVASAHALALVERDPERAVRVCEIARTVLSSEPAPALRLAAVRFACGNDAAAMDALLHADAVMTGAQTLPSASAPAFLIGELSSGSSNAVSLARAAAGVAIVCAGRSPDQIGYMRADTLDELRDHACMVGRDADLALLDRAFRAIERERLATYRGLPPARAA